MKYENGDLFILKYSKNRRLIFLFQDEIGVIKSLLFSRGKPITILILESFIKYDKNAYRVLVSYSNDTHYFGFVFEHALASAVER